MRSVAEVISPFLRDMRPSGVGGIRATCPLCSHARTFIISTESGLFKCFNSACGESGGLAKLLSLTGMPKSEVDYAIKDVYLEKPKQFSFSEKGNVLPERVLGAFEGTPSEMLELGFSKEILTKHEIGFDRRKNRITFPIRNRLGQLVGISGRTLSDFDGPRYLVYHRDFLSVAPNYAPKNRDFLYGINSVYPEKYFVHEDSNPVILVEGYKACLWLRQAGFDFTVALQGSTMTLPQETILHRMRGEKIVFLDKEAGKAYPNRRSYCDAYRICGRLNKYGSARVVVYPSNMKEGTSPDDLNKQQIQMLIQNAKTKNQILLGNLNNGF